MLKIYSREDLYVNLIKTIQKLPCTCMQRMNQLWKGYTIKTNAKILDNCKYLLTLIQAAQNQNYTNIEGLSKFLKLRIDAKVMLTVNIDIQDGLINGQKGIIRHI